MRIKGEMLTDLSCLKFGRLTVVERIEKNGKRNYWLCKCDCGNISVVETFKLKSGHTQSCGCLHKEKFKPEIKDLTNQRFGRLIAKKRVNKPRERGRWLCICDCGEEKEVMQTHLITGKIRSCGCLFSENVHNYAKTHGCSKDRLYNIWQGMKERCFNSNSSQYYLYGARGIVVCDEWKNSFTVFKEWALNNGYNSQLTIDRIENDKGYSSSNCRWVSYKVQNRNKRTNIQITYNGKTQCLTEWAEEINISPKLLNARINKLGWSIEKALTTKVRTNE